MQPFQVPVAAPIRVPSLKSLIESPTDRARDVLDAIDISYRQWKSKIKPDETIELVCFIGERMVVPFKLGLFAKGCIAVHSAEDDGETAIVDFVPVEQLNFRILVSEKKSEKPPRQIGFKVEMEQERQAV
jgi:hypothetical protein